MNLRPLGSQVKQIGRTSGTPTLDLYHRQCEIDRHGMGIWLLHCGNIHIPCRSENRPRSVVEAEPFVQILLFNVSCRCHKFGYSTGERWTRTNLRGVHQHMGVIGIDYDVGEP